MQGVSEGAKADGDDANARVVVVHFSAKDMQVDWDKVNRVAPLVDQALGSKREELAVVANARRLEKFYPHLVRWDVTRSNSVRAIACVCL